VRLGSERPLGERSAGAGTFQTIGARRPIGATVQARSGWSIPPRHSVRVPLPDSMGPTAHTLPLQHAHPQSGVAPGHPFFRAGGNGARLIARELVHGYGEPPQQHHADNALEPARA